MRWISTKRKWYELVEEVIKAHKLCKLNKKVDFLPGDVVSCSYIKGSFYIITINPYYAVIACITNKKDLHYVGFDFLEKIKVNRNTIKVLFNE